MDLIVVVAVCCFPGSVVSVALIVVRLLPVFCSDLSTIVVAGWRWLVMFGYDLDASAVLR